MTKTDQPVTTKSPGPGRGFVWSVAAFVVVLAIGGLYFAFSGDDGQVVDQTTVPTPTTVAPDVETMSDLEVIEAGVAALYSGDAERAVELFELQEPTDDQIRSVHTDDQIRAEAAYQAAIGGRVTLSCTEGTLTPGVFTCTVSYHNAATDAIGFVDDPDSYDPIDAPDSYDVVVEDGVITEFGFPEHTWMVITFGVFLATEGRFEGYEDCLIPPFPESCATIQMENLDGWVEWRENVDLTKIVDAALNAWYGGDCPTALWLSGPWYFDCSESSVETQTIEYESILGAQVSVENCEATSTIVSCEVQYSSAMNNAVGEPPSVTVREFILDGFLLVSDARQDLAPWYRSIWGGYESVYPEDTELRESFRMFAEGGDLQDEYADANCTSVRTPDCANLILENLDEWAAWHETNR